MPKKNDSYTLNDIRWTQIKFFAAGFVFACGALAGLVNLLLSLKGLLL